LGSKDSDKNNRIITKNRKARHLYAIQDTYLAGMILTGSEVKSIRAGNINLTDGYADCVNGELFLVQVHIKEYAFANRNNHSPLRRRKLLLNRREIDKITTAIQEKGCSCVPLKVFLDRGMVKVELGIGKGKKLHDRRQDLKSRDAKREIERQLKG
jgi:SsrA-binding protein